MRTNLDGTSLKDITTLLAGKAITREQAVARCAAVCAKYAPEHPKHKRWAALHAQLTAGQTADYRAAFKVAHPAKPAQPKAAPAINDAAIDAIAAKVFTMLSAKLGL